MAETPSKRPRDDCLLESDLEESKRHKSYNHIISILDEEEDESNQDLSSIITTLQQELSSPPELATSAASSAVGEEEDDKERVIRHLLEASDDELGIPNRQTDFEGFGSSENGLDGCDGENGLDGCDGLELYDGLWEFEDANANYYTLLQAELFM